MDKKLEEKIKNIRSKYKSELVDQQEVEMSFLDEVNELIQVILKDSSIDVYTVLSEERLNEWKKSKFKRFLLKFDLRKTFYFLLLCTITGFLVSEAIGFYSETDVPTTKDWVKAILTEVCFIFLSSYRAIGKMATVAVSTLRVAVFSLMLFVITSGVFFSSATDRSEIANISYQIELVEKQIDDKDKTIERFRSKGWDINAARAEKEKTVLVKKLLELKQRQVETKKSEDISDLIEYKAYGKAIFRVILLFISVLLSRRLFSL